MKTLILKKSVVSIIVKCKSIYTICATLIFLVFIAKVTTTSAQALLFDFDNAPIYTPFPINQTVGGITAHFSGTGQSYSIQDANVLGFTPQGFAGHSIYPNSVYLADLLIGFDQTIMDFSIMYSCQELGCDDAATMRVTAYMNGNLVGTNTKTASVPGTWPVDTLSCSFPQGFDSVVIHYDSAPPTCQDSGVIYMADNMRVTAFNTGILNPEIFANGFVVPNPVSKSATITFTLIQFQHITLTIYDISGRLLQTIFDGNLNAGQHQINWNVNDYAIESGIYLLNLTNENLYRTCKLVVVK